MREFTSAAASPAGDGETIDAFGRNVIRITAEMTGGRLAAMEVTLKPGEGPPTHIHEREDEFFRILSGRFGFWCGEEQIELTEGGLILLPRGVPHRFQNVGETDGSVLVIVTPGGFEGFFSTIAKTVPLAADKIGAIASGFGLTFLPPI